MMTSLRVDKLVVEFIHNGYAVRPLDGLSFEVAAGELVALLGPSGSGKTTLLSCLGGILTLTSGTIHLGETEVTKLSGRALEEYRRSQVGFVFQAFNLIPSLTARENVAMPLLLTGQSRAAAFGRADELLAQVGLTERASHRPSRLSGGQMQRVAVARGLGQNPQLLLADEPTANLDYIQVESIIRLLRELRDQGRMIIISTHDPRLLPIADRVIQMAPDHDHEETPTHQLTFAAGDRIFEQGDQADLIYTVDEGVVDIVRVMADGSEEQLNQLRPGQYFGELGAFLGFPRSASARAGSAVVLTAYSPRVFRERVLNNTSSADAIQSDESG